MERKVSSIILMVVGVVFVILAGAIFVTTAWKYMPEWSKIGLLLLTSLGFFGGSAKASKEEMTVTENVLFYLGTAFAGFFAVAATGGLVSHEVVTNAVRMIIADIVMLIPVSAKLILKRNAFDFNIVTVLESSVLFFIGLATNMPMDKFILLFAGNVVLLSLLDYFMTTRVIENAGMKWSIRIWYYTYLAFYLGSVCLTLLFSVFEYDSMNMFLLVSTLICVIATTITYVANKEILSRLANSFSIMLVVFVTTLISVSEIYGIFNMDVPFTLVMVISFAIGFVIAVITLRKEMVHSLMLAGAAAPVFQLLYYVIDNAFTTGWADSTVKVWSTSYSPFSFILAAGLLALLFRNRAVNGVSEEQEKRYAVLAGLQTIVGINMWAASKNAEMFGMVFFVLGCVGFLSIAAFLKNETAKAVLRTFALISGLFAAFNQAFFEVSAAYIVEWNCLLIGIVIVLLGFIWYDNKKGISLVQFITTCGILATLLFNNLFNSHCGIINVLILGVLGVTILLTAVIRGDKKYAIAATVTLVLMALYITRAFWLSIAWWVYLFVAGLGLILLAIKKEREA